jgi:PKD repeat protein
MKKFSFLICLSIIFNCFKIYSQHHLTHDYDNDHNENLKHLDDNDHEHWHATEFFQDQLYDKFPEKAKNAKKISSDFELFNKNINQKNNSEILIIPTVVHVIYDNNSSNISKEFIKTGINNMNLDFARQNSDTSSIPSVFFDVSANTNIEFRLANLDDNGNCTEGITRTFSSLTNNANNDVKALVQWDPERYFNIWIVNSIGYPDLGLITAGYAQFPFNLQEFPETDGVVIRADSYLERTLVHEAGHWLNLIHPWGDDDCGNDLVDDTPTAKDANFGICDFNGDLAGGNFPYNIGACDPSPGQTITQDFGEMFMNYMDYSSSPCRQMFTTGQSERMRNAISFLRSNLCNNENLLLAGVSDEYINNMYSTDSTLNYLIDTLVINGLQLDSMMLPNFDTTFYNSYVVDTSYVISQTFLINDSLPSIDTIWSYDTSYVELYNIDTSFVTIYENNLMPGWASIANSSLSIDSTLNTYLDSNLVSFTVFSDEIDGIVVNDTVMNYEFFTNTDSTWIFDSVVNVTFDTIINQSFDFSNYPDFFLEFDETNNIILNVFKLDSIEYYTYNESLNLLCPPISDFVSNYTYGCVGDNFIFSSSSYNAPVDSILSYNWTFEGGTPSTSDQPNPSVTYSSSGNYDVSLTLTNSSGDNTKVKTGFINIYSESQNITLHSSHNFFDPNYIQDFESPEFPDYSDEKLNWDILDSQSWEKTDIAGSPVWGQDSKHSIRIRSENFDVDEVHTIITPSFNISGLSSPRVYFDIAYAKKNQASNDILTISSSENCGRTWIPKFTANSEELATNGGQPYYFDFVPNESQWVRFNTSPLSATSNTQFKIEFSGSNGNWLYLDNFVLSSSNENPLKINENILNLDFAIYPNPSIDDATIQLNFINKNILISISNIYGAEIARQNFQTSRLNNSIKISEILNNNTKLESGVYLVEIQHNFVKSVKKLIIY